MTDEYIGIAQKALVEWEAASENKNVSGLNNAAGLFLLALKKAGKPIPRLHSFLAMLYYDLAICHSSMNDRNAARLTSEAISSSVRHADLALETNELEFRAQLIKTYIAGDNVLYLKGVDLAPNSRDVASAIGEMLGKAIGTGAAATRVALSKNDFKKELEKLLAIVSQMEEEYYVDATEFLFFCNKLLAIADYTAENKLFGAKGIYELLLKVDIQELKYENIDEPEDRNAVKAQIEEFMTIAEARQMML